VEHSARACAPGALQAAVFCQRGPAFRETTALARLLLEELLPAGVIEEAGDDSKSTAF
jgi:hypothetical protein